MRHSQLKAFHYVALYSGFSNAAKQLFLTQPAVSEQVRKLEQEHDVLLFLRNRKRVKLTSEGEHLFLLTKRYFEVEQQIDEYISEARSAVDGTLRIIADSAYHVTEILSKFRSHYPKIFVTLRTGNSEDVLEELRSFNAEIGIVGSPPTGNDMETCDMGSSKIIAFAAKNFLSMNKNRMRLEELSKMPLVFREVGSKTRQKLEDEASKRGFKLIPVIEAEGREAVREIVASGAGIGFVSSAEYGNDDRLVVIDLEDIDIRMSETLIYSTQRKDVRVIRAFMDFAKAK